jgi:serine/threonine protein kinase
MSEAFTGTERFRIERRIGSGGMGVVYAAFDNAWRCRVALKTIPRIDPGMLLHLKEEFRALADLSHPNVIQFYELLGDAEQCFFTMELIEGAGFLGYVGRNPAAPQEDIPTSSMVGAAAASPGAEAWACPPPREKVPCAADLERLRPCLRQLAAGVCALHENGRLHRDIKPSNIMVDRSGRAVLLDFGLVSVLHRAQASHAAGTAYYMAPEQAAGRQLTFAADWYAVGATLYEALTGWPPFVGAARDVLAQKQRTAPPSPGDLAAGVPADLEALCMALLETAPERRPAGDDVWAMLGEPRHSAAPRSAQIGRVEALVGRDAEANCLRDAFQDARRGRLTVVFVRGGSGCGKTALINDALDRIAADAEAMVLRGRCYEQESVPYKGFDELLDQVVRILDSWEPDRLRAILPAHIGRLAQAFPVLRRLTPEDAAERASADPVESRRVIRAALRELLRSLAGITPVVLFLDDLHWGDVDTAGLLMELMRPPNSAAMLIVCAFRSHQPSRCLEAISRFPLDAGVDRRDIEVGPLGPEQSHRLAEMLLPDSPWRAQWATWIARESAGNPFFAQVLALYSVRGGTPAALPGGQFAADLTMENAIWLWIQGLPEEAIRVLETIAVCSRPLSHTDALSAANARRDPSLLARLRAAKTVSSTGPGPDDNVQVYHDRIRETILARLPDATLRECHSSLAQTFARHDDPDAEQVAVHCEGAGDTAGAGRWYAMAADRANAALAFDRACGLYRAALKYAPLDDAERLRLERGLADALANSGRGADAARHYMVIHGHAPQQERGALLERAAHLLCASGHVDEGIAAYRTVLAGLGTRFPSSKTWLIAGILWNDLRLRIRGLKFREARAQDVSAAAAARVDALWSASLGLSMVDIAAGAYFILYGLRAALRLGDSGRIARALSWAALHESSRGPKGKQRGLLLLERCREIAEQSGDSRAMMWYQLAGGASWMQLASWRRSIEMLQTAESMLREHGRDVDREITNGQIFLLLAHFGMGNLAEVARRGPAVYERALERGNLFAAACVGSWVIPQVRLALDDPEGARRAADQAVEQWSQQGYHLQHLWAVESKTFVLLYESEGEKAVEYLDSHWRAAVKSLLFRAHLPRAYAIHARARACLMAAERSPQRGRLIREALSLAHRMDKEQAPWCTAAAVLLRAGAAHLRRQPDAIRLLREAERLCARADIGAYVASIRWYLGRLLDGEEAARYRAEAEHWMNAEGIRNPARYVRIYVSGFGALDSAVEPAAGRADASGEPVGR